MATRNILKRSNPEQSTDVVHIYSTLANPQVFVRYEEGGADMPVATAKVSIAGGTGLATKNLITPHGVHTAVDRSAYEQIKDLPHFRDFVNRGFITVQDRKASDIDAVAGDMNIADPSTPLTPADFEKNAEQGLPVLRAAA